MIPEKDAVEVCKLIDKLREEEGSIVEIVSDNADFGGPSCMISVLSEKTNWQEKPFDGDTTLQCLQKAVKELGLE